LSSTCTATKRDGSPCTLPPNGAEGLCWAHDPKNAEKRRRGQTRGGKSKPSKELVGIKERLRSLADDVLAGEVDRANAAVAGQLLNTVIRAIGMEMKVREVEELEARLDGIEEALRARSEGRGWYRGG
jgi:hypothetical protein